MGKDQDIMINAKTSYAHRVIRLCVEGKREENWYGTIHSAYLREPVRFGDFGKALIIIENLLTLRAFPDAMFKHRSFRGFGGRGRSLHSPAKIYHKVEEIANEFGTEETFMLYVTSRNYASIQGHFVNVSTGMISQFNSELHLMQLLEKQMQPTPSEISMSM